MKHLVVIILSLASLLFSAYKVGDYVPDFSFQDTNLDGSSIATYNHTLTELTGTDKQVLLMTYFYPS